MSRPPEYARTIFIIGCSDAVSPSDVSLSQNSVVGDRRYRICEDRFIAERTQRITTDVGESKNFLGVRCVRCARQHLSRRAKCPRHMRSAGTSSYVKTCGKTHQNSSINFSMIGEMSALRRLVSTSTLSFLLGKRSTLVENPQVLP